MSIKTRLTGYQASSEFTASWWVDPRADLAVEAGGAHGLTNAHGIEFDYSFHAQLLTHQNVCAIVSGMKLNAYARQVGVSYRTAFRWFKSGKIQGRQMDTGTILITEPIETPKVPERPTKAAIYTRVSAADAKRKDNLDGQAKRLQDYCAAKGYPVAAIIKEIGSGVNDTRPKLMKLLTDPTITLIVVEHKDRLIGFGFNYIE